MKRVHRQLKQSINSAAQLYDYISIEVAPSVNRTSARLRDIQQDTWNNDSDHVRGKERSAKKQRTERKRKHIETQFMQQAEISRKKDAYKELNSARYAKRKAKQSSVLYKVQGTHILDRTKF